MRGRVSLGRRVEQLAFHQRRQEVLHGEVGLLHVAGVIRRHADRHVDRGSELAAVGARQPDGSQSLPASPIDGATFSCRTTASEVRRSEDSIVGL